MSLTISIDFAASIARLEEQTKKSADAVQQMADRVDSAASFARNALIGLAGAVSVAGIVNATRNAIDYADSLNDLAIRTGSTVEQLSGLRLAAQLSDTSLESLAAGARKLATGLVENRDAFQALGIDTSNQTEALIGLGDVFAGMPDPVERSALAVKVFGKSGEDLIPLLVQGSDGIRQMVEQGQQLAGVTTLMAEQAGVFNDNLDILKLRSEGVFLTLGAELLPVLNETITAFNGMSESGSAVEFIGGAISTVFETIVVLGAEAGFVVRTVGGHIGALAASVAAFVQGDFAGAKAIYGEFIADTVAAREEVDKFSERVLTARQRAKEGTAEAQAPKVVDVRGKQLLQNLSAASAEMDKLRQKDIDGWVKYAEAVLAEGELIESMERERIIRENESQAARELAWQQGVAQRLANLQLAAMSEAEIERGKLTAIQTDLQFARDQGWLTEVSYQQMLQQAQLEHEAKMGNIMAQGALARQRISQLSWMTQASMAASWLKNMTATAATSNKTMFELNKVAGISEAVINTYRAATGAYAALAPIPIIGPALGAAAAGIAIAAGMANVNAIKSAQFGSSTSPPSIAGGGATPVFNAGAATMLDAPAPAEPARAPQTIDFYFSGTSVSMEQMVNEFLPTLEQAIGNGAGSGVIFNVNRA